MMMWVFFFLKQKTAYEMRISDWSSDVCSSDLRRAECDLPGRGGGDRQGADRRLSVERRQRLFDPYRESDRAGAFPARAHDRRSRKRPAVRGDRKSVV